MNPSLICLCASHIESARRFEHFKCMIQSWREQTVKLPLYISLSFDKELLLEEEINKLSEDRLFIYITEKQSQFSHYKTLLKKLSTKINFADMWVMFTDDDDLWHTKRTAEYISTLVQLYSGDRQKIICLINPYVLESSDHATAQTFTEVENLPWNVCHRANFNYTSFSCQIKHLQIFLDKCSENLLNWSYCDVLFSRFVMEAAGTDRSCITGKGLALYFWRNDSSHSHNREQIDDSNYNEQCTLENVKYLIAMSPRITRGNIDTYLKNLQCSHNIDIFNLENIKETKQSTTKALNNDFCKMLRQFPMLIALDKHLK